MSGHVSRKKNFRQYFDVFFFNCKAFGYRCFLFRLSKKTEFFCLAWFFFNQFSAIEIIVFNKNFYHPLKISTLKILSVILIV